MANDISIEFDQTTLDKFNQVLDGIAKDYDTKTGSELHKFIVHTANNLATAIKKSPAMPVKTGRLRASVHAKLKSSDNFKYMADAAAKATNYKSAEEVISKMFDGGLNEPVQEGAEFAVGTNVEYAAKMETLRGFFNSTVQANTANMNKDIDKLAENVMKKNK